VNGRSLRRQWETGRTSLFSLAATSRRLKASKSVPARVAAASSVASQSMPSAPSGILTDDET